MCLYIRIILLTSESPGKLYLGHPLKRNINELIRDAILCRETWSPLVQVIVCCLTPVDLSLLTLLGTYSLTFHSKIKHSIQENGIENVVCINLLIFQLAMPRGLLDISKTCNNTCDRIHVLLFPK